MPKINKETIKESIPNAIPKRAKNSKINTRIVITSVLSIIIPILIIIALSSIIMNITKNDAATSVSSNSYNVLDQMIWSKIAEDIDGSLASDASEEKKLKEVAGYAHKLEKMGAEIYIETGGSQYYSSGSNNNVLKNANEITDIKKDEDLFYFGTSGIAIVNHSQSTSAQYTTVISKQFTQAASTADEAGSKNLINNFRLSAIIIIISIVGVFIFTIIIISLITSKTIIGPIQKITYGANEIAKGNLDCEIDYKSTNELGQLTESFNEMRVRVKEAIEKQNNADQKSREMTAGIAHDLRTPLTSIKGYIEGLKDGIANTPEKQKIYLNTIYESTCSMEKMINDLLTLSKLELGTISLNCEDVSLEDFLSYANSIGKELKKSDFDFEIVDNSRGNPVLYIDTDRFSRVIDNIISNSIKYRNPNIKGKIRLSVTEYEHNVIFELADNGTGVDEESLPRIFETFYRADKARSNVSDGSGIGLSVCRQIVEMHGGMIWAQSKQGEGLSIFISLPSEENDKHNNDERNKK
ncbi:MAG: HAMP domain-containing histidine kinase [Clostridiales bacterium]|nr:HAMP domain-containing histidine kinase [Clostridiales bacterium]